MVSRTTERFRKALNTLPEEIQEKAHKAYRLFQENPDYPSLKFKKIHLSQPIYSIRITADYRALGIIEGDTIIWFWIGSHSQYDKLISKIY